MSGIIGFLIALALLLLFFRLLKLLVILFIIAVIAGLVLNHGGGTGRFDFVTPPANEAPQEPEATPREGKSVMRDAPACQYSYTAYPIQSIACARV